jgi:hypothetical protein
MLRRIRRRDVRASVSLCPGGCECSFGDALGRGAQLLVDTRCFPFQSRSVDVGRALDQIAEIHQQIAKGEVYRGYRSLPVAASGLIGLGAAWLQPRSLAVVDPVGFVIYWGAIALCAGLVGASEIVLNYVVHDEAAARRRTRQVLGQFLPSVAAGAAIGVCFTHLSAALVPLLPGLWAICFGIGTFASRPYLPRASGYVALFYYAAGFVLLWIADVPGTLSGWWIGGTFGVGQLLAAGVLWWNLERPGMDADAHG